MSAAFFSTCVPVALGTTIPSVIVLHVVVYRVRVRCKRGRSRGLHGIHSHLPGLSYIIHTAKVFVGQTTSSVKFRRFSQSNIDLPVLYTLYKLQILARFSVVFVFRIIMPRYGL